MMIGILRGGFRVHMTMFSVALLAHFVSGTAQDGTKGTLPGIQTEGSSVKSSVFRYLPSAATPLGTGMQLAVYQGIITTTPKEVSNGIIKW